MNQSRYAAQEAHSAGDAGSGYVANLTIAV